MIRRIFAASALLALVSCATVEQPPQILSFTADPKEVEQGKPVELRWQVTGATKLFIDQGVGEVTCLHHRTVYPMQVGTYTLLAFGPGGQATARVEVAVWAYGASAHSRNPEPTPSTPTRP
jgi:hypothetical protein